MASIYKIASGWRAQVRMKGKPTASQIFPSKREAQIWAREQEERLHKSSGPNPYITYGEILDQYETAGLRGGTTKQNVLKHLREYWGEYRVLEINTATVAAFAQRRKRGGAAPPTILQDLIYLLTTLRHGGVLANSPEALMAKEMVSTSIKTLGHLGIVAYSEKRERRPTEQELEDLARYFAARPRSSVPMMDIVLWAITTCCRLSEITGRKGAKWQDFDPAERTIWIRGRKHPRKPGGVDMKINLVRDVVTFAGNSVDPVELMHRQKTAYARSGPIFPYSPLTIDNAFIRACQELGIEDLRFHDLRHDGISRLFEADYDIPQVAAISGHRSWRNLQRYTHLRPSSLHRGQPVVTLS